MLLLEKLIIKEQMNYTKHYIKLLRKVNESSDPIRTDDSYSDLDIQLLRELINENYLKGAFSNPDIKRPTIMDMNSTVKGRVFQNELEQQLKDKTVVGRILKYVHVYIAFALGLFAHLITSMMSR